MQLFLAVFVWLELYVIVILGLLQTKRQTNGDQRFLKIYFVR
jgi:hypothetical protein